MKKQDEKDFWNIILKEVGENKRRPRAVIEEIGINPKRAYYLLEKWSNAGLYDYGVSLDLGWITPRGKEKGYYENA